MYKKKKIANKKHRKNKLRLKAKIQESLLKAKPKIKKSVDEPQVDSIEIKTPIEETVKKSPAKKKTTVKKAPTKKKVAAKKAPAKKKTAAKKD